jgi:hypothetical protein
MLQRYTLAHGITCATEALHWARVDRQLASMPKGAQLRRALESCDAGVLESAGHAGSEAARAQMARLLTELVAD